MELQVLDGCNPEDLALWGEIWDSWPDRDVSAHPAYLKLFASPHDQVAAATVVVDGVGRFFYPFLIREIPLRLRGESLFDITTAYGYGGPAFWGTGVPEKAATLFWQTFDKWAKEQRIVSEFVRFSLFSGAEKWYPGEVFDRQPNIIVPVDLDEEELWRKFEPKVRKNVKRARSSGIEVVVKQSGELLDDFLRVYQTTLDRRSASAQYYFSREFFNQFDIDLQGQFAYFYAYRDGSLVSAELVLVSARAVYSFLGGTFSEAFPHRPNDLLKYEIIRWARRQGKESFVLGGGMEAGDGIERYKRAFAPGSLRTFQTGHRVLNTQLYSELSLVADRSPAASEEYFPAYRAGEAV